MIKYDYEITVNGNQAKLNKDIYLFRGNKNVHYYFAVKNASFNFKGSTDLIEKTNAINAAVTVIKPNNVEVASAIAKVENGKIHLKVTEDLIDEEVEVGDFDLVFDLFDDTDGAVTIPKVIGQFHVLERPCTTPISELVATNTTNEVDQALTDYAIVTYAEPVASTNEDGTFAKKTWVPKEKITTAELNRMEEGISDVSSQCKDIAKKIENVGGFDTSKFMYVTKEVEDVDVPCTGIALNTNTLTFTGSDTQTLTVTKTPSNTTDKVTYATNPTGIVVVNNGVVTPIKNGSTVITVTCGSKTATCNVTVTGISTTVAVQSVSLNKNTTTINVGETETLVATISPTNATNQNVTWGTDAPNIATVTNGVVEGKAVGTASISVETVDGSHTDTCNVTVQQNTTETGKNIFDKDTMIDTTKGISGRGEIITNSNWGLATVPVKANTNYSIKRLETVTTGSDNYLYNAVNVGAIGFADSNKTILSYLALDDSNLKNYSVTNSSGKIEWIKITTPSNCSYLLFNTNLRTTADKIQVEEGDTIHNYYTAYEGGNN